MKSTKGYYSLLQYCPDRSRMEAANIGIVLFVPEINFLKAKVSTNNDRVRRFFGPYSFDNKWLRQAKDAISERLKFEKDYISNRESFENFIRTRANELILSDIKSVRIDTPEKQLNELFNELVCRETARGGKKTLIPEIDRNFHSERFQERIQFDKMIDVPVIRKRIQIPYTFMNGRPNLVKTQQFHGDNIARAMELSVEGDFLQKERNKFIIIPKIMDSVKQANDLRSVIQSVFECRDIQTVWPECYEEFINQVDKNAHPIVD